MPTWLSTKVATISSDGSGQHSAFGEARCCNGWSRFCWRRTSSLSGFVFCSFFFFENWLYTATYMADARAQVLPLVTTGDSDFVEHDFYAIFSSLGVLNYDMKIAAVVRLLGWCGMIAVVIWLGLRTARDRES